MPLDFAPDGDMYAPGNLQSVTNWVPTVNDTYAGFNPPYVPAYATAQTSNDVIGSAVLRDTSGTPKFYAGTRTKLYRANTSLATWSDVSGTTYAATSTGTWSFCQFGDSAIAANGFDKLQAATSAGSFADLASTAPAAKIVVVHENAVVAFNTSANPDGWYRSDTGDATNWTASAANDVDSGNLRGGVGGDIVGATVYGPLLIAWKKFGMYAGLFTGGAGGAADPKIRWDFVPGGEGIGLAGQHAFVQTDAGIIFVSPRDIMLFDGGRPRSIAGKVRKWFFPQINNTRQLGYTFMTHDEAERNVYIWTGFGINAGVGTDFPVNALVYNYQTGKWGLGTPKGGAAGTIDYVRCPVRNMTLPDWQAINGGGPNSVNAVWASPHAGTGARLISYEAPNALVVTAYGGVSSATTGLVGNPQRDVEWNRIIQVPARYQSVLSSRPAFANMTGSLVFDNMLNSRSITNGAPDQYGQMDFRANGRYLQASLTWATATAGTRYEWRDLLYEPEPPKLGGNR